MDVVEVGDEAVLRGLAMRMRQFDSSAAKRCGTALRCWTGLDWIARAASTYLAAPDRRGVQWRARQGRAGKPQLTDSTGRLGGQGGGIIIIL